MFRKTLISLVLAFLCGFQARPAGDPGKLGTTLVALAISEGTEETEIQIQTEGRDTDFNCHRRVVEGIPGLVLSFPLAMSRLQASYRVAGAHLRSIEVVASRGEEFAPVEIIFGLKGNSFRGLRKTEGRIQLAFQAPSPAALAAPLEGYRVGPGDRLRISVYGHEDLTRIVEVRADGFISFPLIGDIQIGNKKIEGIQDELRDLLGKDYLVNPQVSVDIEKYQSQWVSVVGEVARPDRYYLRGVTSLVEVLAEAGGLTGDSGSEILVSRRMFSANPGLERQQIYIPRSRLFSDMSPEDNLVLRGGDIINVLPKEYFFIRGAVSRPGSYPLDPGTTLLKAISIAGGLEEFANRKGVELLRVVEGKQERMILNLKAIESRKQEDVPLLPDDIINVPRRFL